PVLMGAPKHRCARLHRGIKEAPAPDGKRQPAILTRHILRPSCRLAAKSRAIPRPRLPAWTRANAHATVGGRIADRRGAHRPAARALPAPTQAVTAPTL